MGQSTTYRLEDISKGHREKVAAAYIMTHIKTGFIYIGSSSHIVKRYHRHYQDLRKGCHQNKTLQSLYNESPDFEFFYYLADSKDSAMNIEQMLIDNHASSGKLINIFTDVKSPNKGGTITEQMKERLRQVNSGKTLSTETKAKISLSLLGRKRPEEFKKRLSKLLTGIPKDPSKREEFIKNRQERFGKKVTIDGIIYPGLRAASRELGVSIPCIKGRVKSDKYPSWTMT